MSERTPPDPSTRKLKRLSEKVAAHRATHAGTLRSAQDVLVLAVQTLVDVDTFADRDLEGEIGLMIKMIRRFIDRLKTHQQAKAGALALTIKALDKADKLLCEAEGRKGYGIKAMKDKAAVDLRRVREVKASVEHRAREAAFVLAELEQAVDPFPGIRMVSAAARARHDEKRKAAMKPPETPLSAEDIELSD